MYAMVQISQYNKKIIIICNMLYNLILSFLQEQINNLLVNNITE